VTATLKTKKIRARFWLWVTCGAAVGVLPVLLNLFLPLLVGGDVPWLEALGDGELLIASTAITGAVIGEVFDCNVEDPDIRWLKNLAAGLALFFCFICAAAYKSVKSYIASVVDDATAAHQAAVSVMISSLVLFAITMFLSGACVWLVAKAKEV
jgi:hypothetical protein